MPQSKTVANGRAIAWQGVAGPLAELLAHSVATWESHGLERIKERTVRSVFRGLLGSIPVHIKVFRAGNLSDRARDALRGPRGHREATNLLSARSLGLPAAEPLAYGMATDTASQRSFVVTRTLVGAEPFHFGMSDEAQAGAGALLRQMHDLGALAGDLHPDNLMVGADNSPHLIDLTSFRHSGEASLVQRAAALAFFCHPLAGGALDRAARSFLSAYRQSGEPLPDELEDQLALATRRWRASALPAFGRRSQRNCRHTEVESRRRATPQWFWHLSCDQNVPPRDRVEALVSAPPPPTKEGRRGAVWVTSDLVMKQREQSLARKLWRAAYWLQFAGIPCAPPIAMRLHRGIGLVVSKRIDNVPLAEELEHLDADALAELASDFGQSVGRLHAHGLRNRDLKFCNLVRDPKTNRIAMVDLDGLRRKTATDSRGCGADLGRLLAAFTAADSPGGSRSLIRFLRGYMREHRNLLLSPPIRRVLRHAERRAGEWAEAHR